METRKKELPMKKDSSSVLTKMASTGRTCSNFWNPPKILGQSKSKELRKRKNFPLNRTKSSSVKKIIKSLISRGREHWDFLGGSMVKNLACDPGDTSLIPCWGTKIPHAVRELSLHATTREARRLWSPNSTTKGPR